MPRTPAMIRPVRADDSEAIASLATQLGYASDGAAIRRRLAALSLGEILVAELSGDVVGWLHVAPLPQLTTEGDARIPAFVVDEAHRSLGIGARLLAAAETWAVTRGCTTISVASRTERGRAHSFYERAGYRVQKTQKKFFKPLSPQPA